MVLWIWYAPAIDPEIAELKPLLGIPLPAINCDPPLENWIITGLFSSDAVSNTEFIVFVPDTLTAGRANFLSFAKLNNCWLFLPKMKLFFKINNCKLLSKILNLFLKRVINTNIKYCLIQAKITKPSLIFYPGRIICFKGSIQS